MRKKLALLLGISFIAFTSFGASYEESLSKLSYTDQYGIKYGEDTISSVPVDIVGRVELLSIIEGTIWNGSSWVTKSQPITHLGMGGFAECTKVTEIIFPSSLSTFDVYNSTSLRYSGRAFQNCWSLTNVVFHGDVPAGIHNTGLLYYSDAISYHVDYREHWRKVLANSGYSGAWIEFSGTWSNRIVVCQKPCGYADMTMQIPNYVYVYQTITNVVNTETVVDHHHYTEVTNRVEACEYVTNFVFTAVTNVIQTFEYVTNVIHTSEVITNVVKYVPESGMSPAPVYQTKAGAAGTIRVEGAAGWDAYGVPDGMTWDRQSGTLNGAANKSGVYDLLLVSGSGTDTKIMRTSLAVEGYATIVGYVGVSFSMSGAPVDCLKSYKTLPAGLKWDSKKKVLSGIPTKAQTISCETIYGDTVTIEIKPAEAAMAGSYNGMIGYYAGDVQDDEWHATGNLTVSVAATGKISAKVVVPQGTYNFSASAWDSVSNGVYRVKMLTKAGDNLCVVLDTTKDWKEARLCSESTFKVCKGENSYIAIAWRNEHGKEGAITKDNNAADFISRITALKKLYLKATKDGDGHYSFVTQTVAKGADVTLTFNANGTVTYSGKVDGTKVSGSSMLAIDGASYYVIFDLVVPVSKTMAMHFAMGFSRGDDGAPISDFEASISDVL